MVIQTRIGYFSSSNGLAGCAQIRKCGYARQTWIRRHTDAVLRVAWQTRASICCCSERTIGASLKNVNGKCNFSIFLASKYIMLCDGVNSHCQHISFTRNSKLHHIMIKCTKCPKRFSSSAMNLQSSWIFYSPQGKAVDQIVNALDGSAATSIFRHGKPECMMLDPNIVGRMIVERSCYYDQGNSISGLFYLRLPKSEVQIPPVRKVDGLEIFSFQN